MGLLAAHLLVMGCAAESTPSPQMGRLHQAMELKPVMVGRIESSGLGTSVAACDGPNFVAGAPGEDSAYFSGDGGRWLPPPSTPGWPPDASVGLAVACGKTFIVIAGPGGAWSVSSSNGGRILDIGVEAIDRQGELFLFGTPHLPSGSDPGARGAVVVQGRLLTGQTLNNQSEGFGSAVAWDSTGLFFAVGDPIAQRAYVYASNATSATTPIASVVWDARSGSEFGAAVALGHFLGPPSSPQQQLIVAAPGVDQIYIFTDLRAAGGSRLEAILTPPEDAGAVEGGSFGRALVLAPMPLLGRPALWVGDPNRDRVYRFIGDAGDMMFNGPPGSGFGHSLAVSAVGLPSRRLFVGAPRHHRDGGPPGVGAVYEFDISAPCVPSDACTDAGGADASQVGRDAGESDSSVPDAGKGDAGQMEPDAGSTNPGAGGGGQSSARFTTCGCSGAGAGLIPLGLLLVARVRRARAGRRN